MLESKYYLTKEGYKQLQEEYQRLLDLRKAKTQGEEVPSTWHSEDINPEYLAYQEDLSLLEARLMEYETILRNAEIIAPPKTKVQEVLIGATVTLREEGENIVNEYTILGTIEANPMEGKISADSPVGKAILGKKIGDEVVINSPIRVVYKIEQIRYVIK